MVLKRQKSNFNRLPKSAIPVDNASYVGYSSYLGNQPFRFVYKTKNKLYCIECFDSFGSISRTCYNFSDRLLCQFVNTNKERVKSCLTSNIGEFEPKNVRLIMPCNNVPISY